MGEEADEYVTAIHDAVESVAMRRGKGNIGALLGALVAVQAHFVAGVSDKKLRESLEDGLKKMLSDQIAVHQKEGFHPNLEIIVKRS